MQLDAPGFLPYFSCRAKTNQKRRDRPGSAKNPPFEEALKNLKASLRPWRPTICRWKRLLAKYEEGARLVKICQEKLAEAELKIQQLEKNAAGRNEIEAVLKTDVE